MRPDDLGVDISYVDGVAVATIRGELDMHTARTLLASLDEVGADQPVVVDMAELEFMDSSGLSLLLVQQARRRKSGGSLQISNPSAAVRRVVAIAGLGELLFDDADPQQSSYPG